MNTEELKGKRLLLLGGSRITCEIIRHARKMGIVCGVTDWYEYEKSPAKQFADEAYYESTSDIDAMVKLIKDKKFDGVMTGFTDSVLPYYAEICEKAGLPAYGTKEQFETYIDKQAYKSLLREFHVPTIPEYSIDFNDVEGSAKNVKYPLLVKPTDGSGSRGITICHNVEELKAAIRTAAASSKANRILVEEYIDAPECTIFWLFKNGEYYFTLLGNRHVKYNQEGVVPLPVGYTYPAACQEEFVKHTAPKMEAMFHYSGIKDGMMFMQCKVVNNVCIVYDIGYRLTGTLEYINLKEMCGYDPLDMMIRHALTGDMGEPDINDKVDATLGGKYTFNVSLLSKPGTIAKIDGLDKVRKMPSIIDVVVAHPEGDTITEKMVGLLAQITVRVFGKADTIEEMKQAMYAVHDSVHIISTEGKEMLLPGMEECDFQGTLLGE